MQHPPQSPGKATGRNGTYARFVTLRTTVSERQLLTAIAVTRADPGQALMNSSRSGLIVSAWVVIIPCGKPW